MTVDESSVPQGAKDALHQARKNIDANIKLTEYMLGLATGEQDMAADYLKKFAGRELSLVRTKLQEAKMWAGKALEAVGSELPEEFRDEA